MICAKGRFGDVVFILSFDGAVADPEHQQECQDFLDKCRDAIEFYARNSLIPLTGDPAITQKMMEDATKLARKGRG